MNKRKNLMEILVFGALLVCILVYYIINAGMSGKNRENVVPKPTTEISETVMPEKEAIVENNNQDFDTNALPKPTHVPTAAPESVSAARADDKAYNDSKLESYTEEPTAVPETVIVDGIEIIQNPQEGVQ